MAIIRNGGRYLVRIGVTHLIFHPGDTWEEFTFVEHHPSQHNDIGSGSQEVPEGECRYVQADRVGSGAHAVIVGKEDGHVIVSVPIGAHDWREFNGENFLDLNIGTGDCKKNHGW